MSQLVHAYNSTKSDATGYSPYFLMFSSEARLPVDIYFETEEEKVSHSQYVEGLKRDLKRAHELCCLFSPTYLKCKLCSWRPTVL